MKKTLIKSFLDTYDSNKGYLRGLKDEPHIRELRHFYSTINNEDLSAAELLALAKILLRKKSRESTTQSAIVFSELVKYFGGYEALDILETEGMLSENNVAFLERHMYEARDIAPSLGKDIAPSLAFISKKVRPSQMHILFNAAVTLVNDELKTLFEVFASLCQKQANSFFDILYFLDSHHFLTPEIILSLKAIGDPEAANSVLNKFRETNPHLLTYDNMVRFCALKHPAFFNQLMTHIPTLNTPHTTSQEVLNSLYALDNALDEQPGIVDILVSFKTLAIDVIPYLGDILATPNKSILIEALNKLSALSLNPQFIPLLLKKIFANSQYAVELVLAAEKLSQAEILDEETLSLVYSSPKFSTQLATSFEILKGKGYYNELSKIFVSESPEYTLGLTQFWINFHDADCKNPTPKIVIAKNPHCAEATAKIIALLQQNKLGKSQNILAVCNALIANDHLLHMLQLMADEKILDQANFERLLPRRAFIKTLYSGAKCFANKGRLDQLNFDSLMVEPINALSLAEDLGGEPVPSVTARKEAEESANNPSTDPGAADFVAIRKSAKVLALGQRHGCLFSPLPSNSEEKKKLLQSFKKATGKKLATAQKEILIKIAEYSGNQTLEPETEHHIAVTSYNLISKGPR